VLATVVRLLQTTLIRVGNLEYTRANGSFGLTTLRCRHASINGATIGFAFNGKRGVKHAVELEDPRLAAIVRKCRDLPGHELFQYLDDERRRQSISSTDVNTYIRQVTGYNFTAKDFRTWFGTLLAFRELRRSAQYRTPSEAKRKLNSALAVVAGCLRNTKAVSLRSYVHPSVIKAYLDGTLLSRKSRRQVPSGLTDEEAELLALLQRVELTTK
jgi:DNA topoisomerase-1